MILKDKVIIITGAGKGIGEVTAKECANEGARVVVSAHHLEDGKRVVREIKGNGGEAIAVEADVSDPCSMENMCRETMDKYGRIDGLVNNAAIYGGIGAMGPFNNITMEVWDREFAVNVRGTFLCCKAVFPYMRGQGKGKIVNIASGVWKSGIPLFLHYASTKGAIVSLTRALSREMGMHGINVNCVCPGLTMTKASLDLAPPQVRKKVVEGVALKRLEEADDLPGTIIFLLSDESDFITGQNLVVDGGVCLH